MEALSSSAISPLERSRAVAELEASRDELLEATQSLSAAQWKFRPFAGRWSIAECCEHVASVESASTGQNLDSGTAGQHGSEQAGAGYIRG